MTLYAGVDDIGYMDGSEGGKRSGLDGGTDIYGIQRTSFHAGDGVITQVIVTKEMIGVVSAQDVVWAWQQRAE